MAVLVHEAETVQITVNVMVKIRQRFNNRQCRAINMNSKEEKRQMPRKTNVKTMPRNEEWSGKTLVLNVINELE